jgi:hypothetical protein
MLVLLVGSLFLVFILGCGGSTGNVSGEVKIKDKPVPSGIITFNPQDSKLRVQTGAILDGKYTVRDVPAGDVTISISNATAAVPTAGVIGKAAVGKKAAAPATVTVPRKYADPKKSGLTFTVKPGENTYNPPLEEDAPPPKK